MRQIDIVLARKVMRLHNSFVNNKMIALETGLSRNTVKGIIDKLATVDVENICDELLHSYLYPQSKDIKYPLFDKNYEELFVEYKSVKQMWSEYSERCVQEGERYIGYNRFCELFNAKYAASKEESKPGSYLYVGWLDRELVFEKGEVRKGYIFAGYFPYSGYVYLDVTQEKNLNSFIQACATLFNDINGIPDNLVYCNRFLVEKIQYNDLVDHYGIRIIIGSDKVKYTFESKCEEVVSLYELNRCRDINSFRDRFKEVYAIDSRLMQTKNLFDNVEQDELGSIPENELDVGIWELRKVYINSHILYHNVYYSVPFQYIGLSVRVQAIGNKLNIYSLRVLIATHVISKSKSNIYITLEKHMPENYSLLKPNKDTFLREAFGIGDNTYWVISKCFDRSKYEVQAYFECRDILKLAKEYGSGHLENACEMLISRRELITVNTIWILINNML